MLTRDEFLSLRAASTVVAVPGGEVRVQEMSVATRIEFLSVIRLNLEAVEAYDADQALPEDQREGVAKAVKLDQSLVTIIFSIVDEGGALMYTLDDYPAFQNQAFAVTMKLWTAVAELARDASHDAVETEKKSSARSRKPGSRSASRSR